jgi:hypothetical protein
MAEREGLTGNIDVPVHRNSEEIRLDIAAERQMLARNVDQLGLRLQEKLEWRSYVRRSPYLVLGAAAGLGLLASGMFRRATPMERLIRSAGKPLSQARDRGLVKKLLFGVTAKVATAWLEQAVSEAVARRAPAAGSPARLEPDAAERAR